MTEKTKFANLINTFFTEYIKLQSIPLTPKVKEKKRKLFLNLIENTSNFSPFALKEMLNSYVTESENSCATFFSILSELNADIADEFPNDKLVAAFTFQGMFSDALFYKEFIEDSESFTLKLNNRLNWLEKQVEYDAIGFVNIREKAD